MMQPSRCYEVVEISVDKKNMMSIAQVQTANGVSRDEPHQWPAAAPRMQVLLIAPFAAPLTIAHEGMSRPRLEAQAAELGLRNIKFIGCPDLDCMPGSLLECYASGLPLIATNAGGIP